LAAARDELLLMLMSLLLLIGVLIWGLPCRIPAGAVCHPSIQLPSFLICFHQNQPSMPATMGNN